LNIILFKITKLVERERGREGGGRREKKDFLSVSRNRRAI
jgi:hypothetical protein